MASKYRTVPVRQARYLTDSDPMIVPGYTSFLEDIQFSDVVASCLVSRIGHFQASYMWLSALSLPYHDLGGAAA